MKSKTTSRRTPKTRARAAHTASRATWPELEGLQASDLARRPAAFFGLSKYASDRAARLVARGPLAYQPV